MISSNPSWYKAALRSSLSVFLIIAAKYYSLLTAFIPIFKRITVAYVGVSYQQPLKPTLRSDPHQRLLAERQVETTLEHRICGPILLTDAVYISHTKRCSRQPYPVCPSIRSKHKRLNIKQSVGSCRDEEASRHPAAQHPHTDCASHSAFGIS
jgi:hypothetical protein